MRLSERISQIAPSATSEMAARAKELKANGVDVISFTTGEPDFNSPDCAVNAAKKAIDEGKTHYTVTKGIPQLRLSISDYYKNLFGLSYDSQSEICVTTGAKQALFQTIACIVNPGDEVILFAPAWVSYVEQIKIFGGVPVLVDTRNTNFVPTRETFENAFSNRTVAVIINNPCNPTGVVYDPEVLKMIGEVSVKHNILIINDEVYGRLVYDMPVQPHLLNLVPQARPQTININAVSKSYAMTGWRLGYAIAPRELIKAMSSIQGHLTSGTCSISQWAAVGAINYGEQDIERMRLEFDRRRNIVTELLKKISHICFHRPNGAFYVFINVEALLNDKTGMKTDIDFCERLLDEKALALVPGTAFLCPGWVRMSYSCSEEQIRKGIGRLKDFIEKVYV